MNAPDASMTEGELQDALAAELQYRGWKVAHFRAARKKAGTWSTPLMYDGGGWPDIVAVHPVGGVLAIECKSARGRLSTTQRDWIAAFRAAGATALVAFPISVHDVSATIRSLTDRPARLLEPPKRR